MCKKSCEPLVVGSFMFKMFSIVMATVILALAALYFGGGVESVNPSDFDSEEVIPRQPPERGPLGEWPM